MVHHMGFKIHVTVGVQMEGDRGITLLDFAVLKAGYRNGFIDLRFLFFVEIATDFNVLPSLRRRCLRREPG
jgi:hypothetical protein